MSDPDLASDPGSPSGSASPAFTAALANEQFILQSVSGATISESSGRAALYLSTLSSGLVAIGFASSSGAALTSIAFTVLPTVFVLGCFTVVRLIDTSVENLVALRRIERIRRYWATLSPEGAVFFTPDSAATGRRGVHYGFWSMLFTLASMIVVVNGVLAGSILALFLTRVAGVPRLLAVPVGIVLALGGIAAALAYEHRRIDALVQGEG